MKPVTPTSSTNSCDRQKRDVHYLDNPTEEDIQLFKETSQLHSRLKREVELGSVPKENATRYCAERISETKIGKLCAKIGVNVQALVNTCSADVEVSTLFSKLNYAPYIPIGCWVTRIPAISSVFIILAFNMTDIITSAVCPDLKDIDN